MSARHKVQWAGVNLGDAFRAHLDYQRRIPALRLFYRLCADVQRAVGGLCAVGVESGGFEARAKPQLGPCYTDHPAGPAAMAAAGLTAIVEYHHHAQGLAERLKAAASSCLPRYGWTGTERSLSIAVHAAATAVAGRVVIEILRRTSAASAVEHYRLFLSARQPGRLETPQEVVMSIALFGDLWPPAAALSLSDSSRRLLANLAEKSDIYLRLVATARADELETLAVEWTLVLCLAMGPPTAGSMDAPASVVGAPSSGLEAGGGDVRDILEQAMGETPDARAENAVNRCAEALARAVATASPDEPRPDVVERLLRDNAFAATRFEGDPLEGREVSAPQQGHDPITGHLVDRALRPSDDLPAAERLLAEAAPLTAALRRALYPSTRELPLEERYRTSGSLDPRRMFLHEVSSAVFRRYRAHEVPDRSGRAVLAIACDGSGSLDPDQIHMTRLLAAAWLQATVRSEVEVLAAVYCGQQDRHADNVPLVEWIHHPRKTPVSSRSEALRVLPSVSSEGRGAQADVLSLAFILDEARVLARGQTVYLVVISDCRWNASAPGGKGLEEMDAFLAAARTDAGTRLHVTLVALAPPARAMLDHRIDGAVQVSQDEMGDPGAVARKVSDHVAACMRRRWEGSDETGTS